MYQDICQFENSVLVFFKPTHSLAEILCNSVATQYHKFALYISNNGFFSSMLNDTQSVYFFSQREYERGVQDCDSALCVSEGSRRALYRKALCLRELGRFREAYECGTKCLLTAPHVCHQY